MARRKRLRPPSRRGAGAARRFHWTTLAGYPALVLLLTFFWLGTRGAADAPLPEATHGCLVDGLAGAASVAAAGGAGALVFVVVPILVVAVLTARSVTLGLRGPRSFRIIEDYRRTWTAPEPERTAGEQQPG